MWGSSPGVVPAQAPAFQGRDQEPDTESAPGTAESSPGATESASGAVESAPGDASSAPDTAETAPFRSGSECDINLKSRDYPGDCSRDSVRVCDCARSRDLDRDRDSGGPCSCASGAPCATPPCSDASPGLAHHQQQQQVMPYRGVEATAAPHEPTRAFDRPTPVSQKPAWVSHRPAWVCRGPAWVCFVALSLLLVWGCGVGKHSLHKDSIDYGHRHQGEKQRPQGHWSHLLGSLISISSGMGGEDAVQGAHTGQQQRHRLFVWRWRQEKEGPEEGGPQAEVEVDFLDRATLRPLFSLRVPLSGPLRGRAGRMQVLLEVDPWAEEADIEHLKKELERSLRCNTGGTAAGALAMEAGGIRRQLAPAWLPWGHQGNEKRGDEGTGGVHRRQLAPAWLRDAWVKGITFRRASGEDEVSALLIGSHQDEAEDWPWPASLIADEEKSPFVGDWKISLKTKACAGGLVPMDAAEADPPPLLNSEDVHKKELWKGASMLPRFLVWLPRFGLGNTLRGYCSAFVFAFLSGRRLVRWHGGAHKHVLDLLCSSFECGGASLVDLKGNIKSVSEELNARQSTHGLEDMLQDIVRSLFVQAGHNFGGYWSKNKRLRRCVLVALGCSSDWCVNSRAIQHLLRNGPAPATADLVERILRKFDANSAISTPKQLQDSPDSPSQGNVTVESGAEGGVGSGPGTAETLDSQGPAIPPGSALKLQFDVAVHIRTQARVLESAECGKPTAACSEVLVRYKEADEARMREYLDPQAWACMSLLLSNLTANKAASKGVSGEGAGRVGGSGPPEFNIFLATDNEKLRPKFIELLSPHGTVFYSSAAVAHTSKSQDEVSKLATMAEFFLLARAHVLISYNKYISTFAVFASTYSNATLLARHVQPDPKHCHFKVEHRGVLKQ